jgi:hypothetical protein
MLPTKLGSFGQAVSEEKIFLGIDQSASRTANVVGSIYGRPSIKLAHFGSVNKHGQHRQFVLLIGRFIKNLLNLLSL